MRSSRRGVGCLRQWLRLRVGRPGKSYPERGATAGGAEDRNAAIVLRDEGVDDGKAEPAPPVARLRSRSTHYLSGVTTSGGVAVDGGAFAGLGVGLVGGIGQHEKPGSWPMCAGRGNRRLADRVDRLTPSGCPLCLRQFARHGLICSVL